MVSEAPAGIAELLGVEWPHKDLKTVGEQGPAAAGYGEATAVLALLEEEQRLPLRCVGALAGVGRMLLMRDLC